RLTDVPRRAFTLMFPVATALIARPEALELLPTCVMVPPPPLVAWNVRLPEALVRMFSNCRLPAADVPAVRLTSPPLLLRLETVRLVPAMKVSDPPCVLTVLATLTKVMAPL